MHGRANRGMRAMNIQNRGIAAINFEKRGIAIIRHFFLGAVWRGGGGCVAWRCRQYRFLAPPAVAPCAVRQLDFLRSVSRVDVRQRRCLNGV